MKPAIGVIRAGIVVACTVVCTSAATDTQQDCQILAPPQTGHAATLAQEIAIDMLAPPPD